MSTFTTSCVPPSLGAPSVTSGPVGTIVTITGSHFNNSSPLTVYFGDTSTSAPITSGGTSAADGSVNVTFTVPFAGNGSHSIIVSDGTNSATSATAFTVTGSFDGIAFTGVVLNNGSNTGTETCAGATVSQSWKCTANFQNNAGSFSAFGTFENAAGAAITNTGAAVGVNCRETDTGNKTGGSVSPSSSSINTGKSATSSAFTLTNPAGGWKGTMSCSASVAGLTYTFAVDAK
jgi:hypothetical protein